ncbi:hypothetical protein KC315_g18176, partial [Hortaea werneckii]
MASLNIFIWAMILCTLISGGKAAPMPDSENKKKKKKKKKKKEKKKKKKKKKKKTRKEYTNSISRLHIKPSSPSSINGIATTKNFLTPYHPL